MNVHRPPGPSNRLLSTYRVLSDPFRWMETWRAKYGDPFMLPSLNGRIAMTGEPELLKLIFRTEPGIYEPFAAEAVAPLLGATALVLERGDRHRQDRKLLMPPFHGERMRAYAETMGEVARRHMRAAAASDSTCLAIDMGQAISLEVIVRAVFGVEEPERVVEFERAIVRFVESFAPVLSFASFLQKPWFGPWRRFHGEYEAFDALLQDQIERVRARGLGEDILSLMLEARYEDGSPMPDAEVRDQLRVLLVAGHETTAVTLAWVFDCLGRNPEELERVRAEADAAGDAPAAWAKLPRARAVVDETMRLFPVVTETMRVLNAPLEFGSFRLGPGDCVGAGILLAHNRPETYPAPRTWRPQRFVDRKFGPFEFLPFGGGHRRCIGAAFSIMEMQITLALALREFDFSLVGSQPAYPKRRNIIMAPEGGVPMRLSARKGLQAAA